MKTMIWATLFHLGRLKGFVNASRSSVLNESRRKRVFDAIDQVAAETRNWSTP